MRWLTLLLFSSFLFSQVYETKDINFYEEFGCHPSVTFLKDMNLGVQIFQALETKNTLALGGYSGVLFFAEHASGKKSSKLTADALLYQAIAIAMEQQDKNSLEQLLKILEDPYIGPGNTKKAQEFRYDFENQKKLKATYSLDRKIKVVPNWAEVKTGEEIFFKVFYEDNNEEVPVEELTFFANYGQFWVIWANRYMAPNYACDDIIHVKHLKTGQSASAIISITNLFDSSFPVSPWKPQTKNKIEVPKPSQDAQQFLLKEESARLQARANMLKEIKRILFFLATKDKSFQTVADSLVSPFEDTLLAGSSVKKAYRYSDDPTQLKVTVSISKKWAVESIQRHCERKKIFFSESMKKTLEDTLQQIDTQDIEVEGSSSF